MTPEQWHLVPNSILRDGTEFLGWLADRGLRAPTLLELDTERRRRSLLPPRTKES
jgi:hypothetical protein